MRKTVVIMRHAKAKRPVEGQPDLERPLSEAGKRAEAATLPDAVLLWPQGTAEVWTSPAKRAFQTARMLVAALSAQGVDVGGIARTMPCLWDGDGAALARAIVESPADVIAIVGHNPLVEAWCRALSGAELRFATGSLAAIELDIDDTILASVSWPDLFGIPGDVEDSDNRETSPALERVMPTELYVLGAHSRLLWFVQGPVSQRWKTLSTIEKVLRTGSDTVAERLAAFQEDPDDIETMHKFRVSIRTLRSLAAFVRPWQDKRQNACVNDELRSVVRLTSRQRELDVLAEQCAERPDSSEELVSFLREAAAAERKRVMKALASKKTRKSLARVGKELSDVSWRPRIVHDGLDPSEMRARFDALASALANDLAALDLADVERTHDVRKRAKRVRYNAEKFSDIIGGDAVGIAKDMTAHQDNLGAICDARVNIDIVNSFLEQDLPPEISRELALLRTENEDYLRDTLGY